MLATTTRIGDGLVTIVAGMRQRRSCWSASCDILCVMGLVELIVANRTCGRVDEYADEYVETEFLCVLRLPLVPRRSFWIAEAAGVRIGFPIRAHVRSVMAAYLRTWTVLAAVTVLATWPAATAVLVSMALFAAFAASWTWWPRDPDALWHVKFDLAAFGSRCDPARLMPAMRARLGQELACRRAGDPAIRDAAEVTGLGPRSGEEALVTYGESRLAEAVTPSSPGTRGDLMDQVMYKAYRRPRRVGDPFRDRFFEDELGRLSTEIDEIAEAQVRDRQSGRGMFRGVPPRALPTPAWLQSARLWLGVLAAATLATSGPAMETLSRGLGRPGPGAIGDALVMAVALATLAGWPAWLRVRRWRQHTRWITSM
jgi:hypothetical protein